MSSKKSDSTPVNFLEGELMSTAMLPVSSPVLLTKDAINAKYAKGDVRIVTEQARYPLPTVVHMVESGDYNLQPEFQRRHTWSAQQQSRLIESFIMNVPIPPIFLYEVEYSRYEVMDGLQRMTAIHRFYRDKFKLEGLEQWRELNGFSYSTLPDQVRKGIDRRYLSSLILLKETAASLEEAQRLKQLVFERINSGGVDLSGQESRNAIYDGPLNKRIRKTIPSPRDYPTFWCRSQPAGVRESRSRILTHPNPGSTSSKYSRTGTRSLRQDSSTLKIAATFGPATGLPTWIQFFRPSAIPRIEFSARFVLSSSSG